jgi:hypothetical protein
MNNTEKAISAVRRIDKRIAELEQQLNMAGKEAQTAEAEAAALAGESGFDGAVDRIARASARRTALGAALAKLNEERHAAVLAVAEARRAELTAEADKLDAEILAIHKEAQRMLDKLAALMEVEVFPISILFGRTVTPVDRRNLDPDALPMDFIQLAPKTVEMRQRYWNLRAEAKRLEDPVEAQRTARRLLGEEAE